MKPSEPNRRTEPARRRGRPRGPHAAARSRTRQRLLDGALEAITRRGLGKLAISDVSECAGVSRGTAYKYFPNTEELIVELARREAERFEEQVFSAMEEAPEGEERLRVALEFSARLAREHPALRRLPETDPALVLTVMRERIPDIRTALSRLFAPLLDQTEAVRSGCASSDQLVDWLTRLLLSTFLFPDPHPDQTAAAMGAMHRLLERGPATQARRD